MESESTARLLDDSAELVQTDTFCRHVIT